MTYQKPGWFTDLLFSSLTLLLSLFLSLKCMLWRWPSKSLYTWKRGQRWYTAWDLSLRFCMCFDLFSTFMVHSAANLQTSKTKFCLFSKLSSFVCSQGKLYGIKLFSFDTKHFVLQFVFFIWNVQKNFRGEPGIVYTLKNVRLHTLQC